MEIKRYLAEPPVLASPEANETLFVYLAVSDVAVSAAPVQRKCGWKAEASVLLQQVLSRLRNQIHPP